MGRDVDDLDAVFRALADPGRRSLLDALDRHSPQTLAELCTGLAITRQAVSKHLAVLEGAGLVTTRRQGREKLHALNPVPVHAIADRWVKRYERHRVAALADLRTALESTTASRTATEEPIVTSQTFTTQQAFTYTSYIRTTPEALWQALTEPAFTKVYWGVELESDWQVGSTVTWHVAGIAIADPAQTVLAADPPRRLSFTWHSITDEFGAAIGADPAELARIAAEPRSKVTFEIEPADVPTQGSVRLTVTHDDFTPGGDLQAGVSQGWPQIVSALKTLLEREPEAH